MDPKCRSAVAHVISIARYIDKLRDKPGGADVPDGYEETLDKMETANHELLFILSARIASTSDID